MNTRPVVERFWAKVDKTSADECWLWHGAKTQAGYSTLHLNGTRTTAHRIAYELFVGPIPEGFEIDHLCRIKPCVNPKHLEAVPHWLNILRTGGPPAIATKRDHCAKGHAYTSLNTRMRLDRRNTRLCIACQNANRPVAINPPNAKKTHCPAGHSYDLINTHWYRGRRSCRTCRNAHPERVRARNLSSQGAQGQQA